MNKLNLDGSSVSSISPLLTVKDLAKLLHVSTRTLWRLKSKRAIPSPVRFGGTVRWRGQDIQKWLDEGCPKNTSCDHDLDD